MQRSVLRRLAVVAAAFALLWLMLRYLLPLALPFLLGAGLALAAEPMTRTLGGKLHLPRGAAAGISVTAVFVLILALTTLLGALLVRQLRSLSGVLPNLEQTARQGVASLQSWLLSIAGAAPQSLRTVLTRNIQTFFSSGSALANRMGTQLLRMASGVLLRLPDSLLSIGTGILSGFMISARLPQLKTLLHRFLPAGWRDRWLPALKRLKSTMGSWLLAQLKLIGVTLLLLTAGFLILQIPYAPIWAAVVALVDALPVLGTGTILIPWALICALQHNPVRAVGLLGVYAVVWLTRSVLEPRLLGKQLGLDPLATLVAMYLGYRLWGIAGMMLSPIFAVFATQLTQLQPDTKS